MKWAGEENRTPPISLGSWGTTTMRHPHLKIAREIKRFKDDIASQIPDISVFSSYYSWLVLSSYKNRSANNGAWELRWFLNSNKWRCVDFFWVAWRGEISLNVWYTRAHSQIQDVALEICIPQHFVVLCKLILVIICLPSIFVTLGNSDPNHVQDTIQTSQPTIGYRTSLCHFSAIFDLRS